MIIRTKSTSVYTFGEPDGNGVRTIRKYSERAHRYISFDFEECRILGSGRRTSLDPGYKLLHATPQVGEELLIKPVRDGHERSDEIVVTSEIVSIE